MWPRCSCVMRVVSVLRQKQCAGELHISQPPVEILLSCLLSGVLWCLGYIYVEFCINPMVVARVVIFKVVWCL